MSENKKRISIEVDAEFHKQLKLFASHINDVLNSIDLKSASDAGGIGQALTKVASQANNAGVSLEKTAAMIATIKDVTQDSDDSIGTGLKSIFSRMNQIKAGKFVDSETGESLNDVEKVLKKVGISMRDVNGQFKESEPVIDEVAQKWSTFDGKFYFLQRSSCRFTRTSDCT